jgi:hypothetical protein
MPLAELKRPRFNFPQKNCVIDLSERPLELQMGFLGGIDRHSSDYSAVEERADVPGDISPICFDT